MTNIILSPFTDGVILHGKRPIVPLTASTIWIDSVVVDVEFVFGIYLSIGLLFVRSTRLIGKPMHFNLCEFIRPNAANSMNVNKFISGNKIKPKNTISIINTNLVLILAVWICWMGESNARFGSIIGLPCPRLFQRFKQFCAHPLHTHIHKPMAHIALHRITYGWCCTFFELFTPDINTKEGPEWVYRVCVCVYNIRFPKSIAKSKLLFAIGEKPIYYYDIVDNLTNPWGIISHRY